MNKVQMNDNNKQAEPIVSLNLIDRIAQSKRPKVSNDTHENIDISKELEYFHTSKTVGPALRSLIQHLLLIRPTSVDSERAFSICGLLDTCRRGSIKPEKFSKIIFLNQNLYKFN